MRKLVGVLVLLVVGCAAPSTYIMPEPYAAYDDGLAQAEMAVAEAKADQKLALIILGGNWCHDSKSLAKRLKSDEIAAVLAEGYATRLISVGYLDAADDVAARYAAEGAYLHTPTVLIVDPGTGQTINRDDHLQFRDAAKLSDAEILAYFEKFARREGAAGPILPEAVMADPSNPYTVRWADIENNFKSPNVARLNAANAIIGPKLAARTSDLNDYWYPVRDFRYALGKDLLSLRQDLTGQYAAGTLAFEEFPTYPAFDWEDQPKAK